MCDTQINKVTFSSATAVVNKTTPVYCGASVNKTHTAVFTPTSSPVFHYPHT